MASPTPPGKLYAIFTLAAVEWVPVFWEGWMSFIALAMFVLVLFFGQHYGGWTDPGGKVQLTLITCFLMGAVCGYKARG